MSIFEEFNNIKINNPNNSHIVNQFIKYYEHVYSNYNSFNKTSQEMYFKLNAIKKNIFFIASLKKQITSGQELEKYKGVGKKTVEKINQIIKHGYILEIKNFESTNNSKQNQKKINIIQELSSIHGIGTTKASEFYEKYNVTSIKDLINKYKKGQISLSEQMLLGIKYKKILIQEIPNSLILSLDIYITKIIHDYDKNFIIVFCGSFRRGKEFPSDIDILISHKNLHNLENSYKYLSEIVSLFDNIIVDKLTENFNTHFQAFGTFRNIPHLPQEYDKNKFNVNKNVFRLDIIIVPLQSFYPALMHFTGSGNFNKKMRIHAKSMGMKLNEYGLYKLENNKEVPLKITSEKDIFTHLLLKYISPENRV